MVYVLNKYGKPLMPTTRYGRVRRLLRKGLAVVVDYRPFTIQLTYVTPNGVQEVSLGVDAGTKHVGFSATTKKKVFFEAELLLRSDIVEKLSTRREFRRARRNRKTRYRNKRFLNRTGSKKPGWLAPSVRQKVDTHIHWISRICKLLPIKKITVETAQFDTQLLKAQEHGLPLPQGTDYQKGEQLGFWNVREYVLFRDGHKCQCCKGVRGFRLMDSVEYAYRECFLGGRRVSGSFSVADITGKVLADSVSYRKMTLKHHNNTYIMEEAALLSPTKDG